MQWSVSSLFLFWPLCPHGKYCDSATDNESVSLRKLPFHPTILLFRFPPSWWPWGPLTHLTDFRMLAKGGRGNLSGSYARLNYLHAKVFIDGGSTKSITSATFTPLGETVQAHTKRIKKTFHFAKTQTSTPLFLLQLPLGCMYCYFLFISATEKKNANSSSQTANLFRFSLSSRDINNSPKKRFPCETRTLPMHSTQCNIVGSIKTPKHQNLKCICWKSQHSGNAGILWKVKHQMPSFSLPCCYNMEQSAPCSCWMHYIKQYSCL